MSEEGGREGRRIHHQLPNHTAEERQRGERERQEVRCPPLRVTSLDDRNRCKERMGRSLLFT